MVGVGQLCASFDLRRDELLQFAVVQQGVDAVSQLHDPAGNVMLAVDGPNRHVGTERGFVVAPTTGRYRLEIASFQPHGRGRFELRVEARRPATRRDRLLAAAAELTGKSLRVRPPSPGSRSPAAEERWLGAALRLWIAAGEPEQIALTRLRLGLHRQLAADPRGALRHYRRLLPFWSGQPQEIPLLNLMGKAEVAVGEVEAGYRHFEEARRLARKLSDAGEEADALANRAGVEAARGEIQRALDDIRVVLRIRRQDRDDEGIAAELARLGDLYLQLGQPEVAAHTALQALAAREHGGLDEDYQLLRTLGLARMAQEQWDPALDALAESLAACWRSVRRDHAVYILDAYGLALLGKGEPEQALAQLQAALALARQSGDRQAQADTLANLGEVAGFGFGDWERALRRFAAAESLYHSVAARAALPEVRYGQALALWKLGRLEEAARAFAAAVDGVEALRSQPRRGDLRASFLASRREYFSSYVVLLAELERRQPGHGWAARALEVAERARARSLLEELREAETGVRRGIAPPLLRRKVELERQIAARQLSRWRLGGSDTDPQAEAVLAALLDRYEDLLAEIRAESPRYAALTEPRPLGLAEVQRLLDADTSLLVYVLGKERSALLHVTREAVSIHLLPGRAKLERAAWQVYRRLVASRAPASLPVLLPSLQGLSSLLLGPVARELRNPGQRLVVLGDGALDYIPFGALPEPSPPSPGRSPPRYLVERHEIVYLPSASVLELLRQEVEGRPRPPKTIALLADPVFAGDPRLAGRPPTGRPAPPPRLPPPLQLAARDDHPEAFERLWHSGWEAEAIVRRLPAGQAFLALGFEANLATAKSPELRQYRILHFATHGILNEKHPQLSGLVLSQYDAAGRRRDGFLRLYDVYNLNLPIDLVVLSACRTALGPEVRGEGLIGLTRGFMYAGAPRVVVSLWQVDDAATAKLMELFYRHLLAEKRTPAAALRQAQVEMSADPRRQAPYYWAGFVLQGDWR